MAEKLTRLSVEEWHVSKRTLTLHDDHYLVEPHERNGGISSAIIVESCRNKPLPVGSILLTDGGGWEWTKMTKEGEKKYRIIRGSMIIGVLS